MKRAGLDVGILGPEQSCYSESIRQTGNEELVKTLVNSNIGALNAAGVKKMVVDSPHCFHTLKDECPEFSGNFEVEHFSQFLARQVKEGNIKPIKSLGKKVAYHDSCYLGRHNNVYDEPRSILSTIPDLELVEMANHHQESLCCDGGGGHIWVETKKEERFSDIRVQEAIETNADILATSCPYRMANFEDSILTMNLVDKLQKKIAELVLEAL